MNKDLYLKQIQNISLKFFTPLLNKKKSTKAKKGDRPQILVFLKGKAFPCLPSKSLQESSLQAVPILSALLLVRHPFCGGHPRNAPKKNYTKTKNKVCPSLFLAKKRHLSFLRCHKINQVIFSSYTVLHTVPIKEVIKIVAYATGGSAKYIIVLTCLKQKNR